MLIKNYYLILARFGVALALLGVAKVLILDGRSEHGGQIRNKSGISIFLKAFGYIDRKRPILLYMCEKLSELPSYLSTMGVA